jgi:hypothetical protein
MRLTALLGIRSSDLKLSKALVGWVIIRVRAGKC